MSSNSGEDEDNGSYQGHQYIVGTEFEAWADDGAAEVEGEADAVWFGDSYWVDDPLDVEITITSNVTIEYEDVDESTFSVSTPDIWSVTRSQNRWEASITDVFEDNSTPSLRHNRGALTFYGGDGSCVNWVQQDDTFKYDYETGDTEFYGTSVIVEPDNCGFWPWDEKDE